MKLLVTRPEADNAALARSLAALGHETISAPLLSIRFLDNAGLPSRNWQALLITSANGARALGRRADADALKAISVFTVGQASAEAMAQEGFAHITAAGGDVAALAVLVASQLRPEAGPLLHVTGSVVAGDLGGSLAARGFEVVRAILYEAEKVQRLPDAAREALATGSLDGVLLHSPRTARLFASLVTEAGLQGKLEGVTAYCLSAAVAEALAGLPMLTVRISPEPTQAALLALISA
ncbi:MAG: uroporphyrinogen-III synthase [Parvibaculum sp.]